MQKPDNIVHSLLLIHKFLIKHNTLDTTSIIFISSRKHSNISLFFDEMLIDNFLFLIKLY